MGKASPPQPPNPYQVANAQTSSNIGTAIANSYIGNANTYTPFGSTEYTRDKMQKFQVREGNRLRTYWVPTWNVKQTLSPDQQTLLNLQENTMRNLGVTAQQQSEFLRHYLDEGMDTSNLPSSVTDAAHAQGLQTAQSPDDFSADRRRVEQALYSRLEPQQDRDRSAMEARLANQGVTQGSEAYRNAMDELNRSKTDARMQTILAGGQEQDRLYKLALDQANQANAVIQGNFENRGTEQQNQQTLRQQALQELMSLRNQPLSEISQLLNGSQPTIPQFQQFNPGHVANTPVGQYIYQSAAMNNQNYATQQQSQNALLGGLFGLGSSFFFSDRRLKENIVRAAKLDNGLNVYAYNFKNNPRTELGVMADEVEKVMPFAVITDPSGFKKVNYDMAVL